MTKAYHCPSIAVMVVAAVVGRLLILYVGRVLPAMLTPKPMLVIAAAVAAEVFAAKPIKLMLEPVVDLVRAIIAIKTIASIVATTTAINLNRGAVFSQLSSVAAVHAKLVRLLIAVRLVKLIVVAWPVVRQVEQLTTVAAVESDFIKAHQLRLLLKRAE